MLTPRPYLSFHSMTLFEKSQEEWLDYYIYDPENKNKKRRISRNMAYGSMLAKGLEDEKATGDPLLDLMAARLPKFELMDIAFEADLKDKKGVIRVLAKPDTCKSDYSAFKEYKTSVRKWTQRMADESGQITFYAMVMWLKTGKIPQDIELICVPVEYQSDCSLSPTGELVRLPTKRTLADIIKMSSRARRAWKGIQKLVENELL